VFTYRCPSCGKQHTADRPFAGPFQATCLRCGVTIPVTRELVHGAAEAPVEHAITRRPPAVRTTRGADGGTTEEGPPGEDVLEEVPDDGAPEGEDEANAEG